LQNTKLDCELHDLKLDKKVKFVDIKRDFFDVDEPKDKKSFGRLCADNMEMIDGSASQRMRKGSVYF